MGEYITIDDLTEDEIEQLKDVLQVAKGLSDSIIQVMPGSDRVLEEFPAVNPMGHYSEIDMGFTERMKRCECASRLRDPLAWEMYQDLKETWALLPWPGPGLVLLRGPRPGCPPPSWVPLGASPWPPAWRSQPPAGGLWALQLSAPFQAPAPLRGLSQGHLSPDVPFLSADSSPILCTQHPEIPPGAGCGPPHGAGRLRGQQAKQQGQETRLPSFSISAKPCIHPPRGQT